MKQLHSFPDLTDPQIGPLATASAYAASYRKSKTNLHPTATPTGLRNAFGGELPAKGQPGTEVIADLIHAAEPGLVGNTQTGFHAWVMGSSHPTGVAEDWLTSVWGQNAGIFQCSPAAATAEEVACNWLADMIRNHCDCASLLAHKLSAVPGIRILNDVVLNQVVLAFDPIREGDDPDVMAPRMEAALNEDGRHFFRSAFWQGRRVLRVSIISQDTGPEQVQELAAKIRQLWTEIGQ